MAAGAAIAPASSAFRWASARSRRADAPGEAISRASDFLLRAQSEDGAWRGRDYAVFRDGSALTPFAMKALLALPPSRERLTAATRGAAFLSSFVRQGDVAPPQGTLAYPVYTAALAVLALELLRRAGESRHVDWNFAPPDPSPWLRLLESHQLDERLGWTRDDAAFGGWGYSPAPPRRPVDGLTRPPFDSDLSSTMFAVSALRISGRATDDPAIRNALVFVERCQNFGSDADDGGFFLTPTNAIQNKAGASEPGHAQRAPYHSYGSATADGVRALVRCGASHDAPRVTAARRWLERNFSTITNPGVFTPQREPDRDAAYFYYSWSMAHAFRLLGLRRFDYEGQTIDWTAALAEAIIGRQREDGSWSNRFSFMKEDDPLVATPLAMGALGCALLVSRGA
jgi:squalene-hopene/tetraprenyl-beta-curcumene cyclase